MSTLIAADIATGFALIADHGGRYPGGRSLYDPDPDGPSVLRWTRDVP
ncbi:hypothetical protein ACWC5I_21850 [Kitasatospora sp. NPDC001574]